MNRLLPSLAVVLAAAAALPSALAQPHRERHGDERYRSPHWVYDNRYHHAHYYPAVGYSVTVLPTGYLSLTFHGGRFFFHGGVWFRPAGAVYVVARPPVGIVVPALPPAYTVVYAGGVPYYYANEIYYSAMPGGAGYSVVAPPAGAEPTTAASPASLPPPAGGAVPGPATQPQAGVWYYCESAKGYYPYVAECREGWRTVPATPPR
jgi:Family of unknown function (DUF6515)